MELKIKKTDGEKRKKGSKEINREVKYNAFLFSGIAISIFKFMYCKSSHRVKAQADKTTIYFQI